jgi:hypothetical protein
MRGASYGVQSFCGGCAWITGVFSDGELSKSNKSPVVGVLIALGDVLRVQETVLDQRQQRVKVEVRPGCN